MRIFRSAVLALVGVIVCISSLYAARTKEQASTYADYGFVNYIATSLRHVYFATTNGIIVYNKVEQKWAPPIAGAEGIDSEDIKRIWVDRFDQGLYAQTNLGTYSYDSLWGRWSDVNTVPSVSSDDSHIATPISMVPPFRYNYSPEGSLIDPYGRSYSISDMVDDGSGTIWVGTWGHGPARTLGSGGQLELLPYGLLQDPAYTIYEDGRDLWIAGPILNSIRTGITIFDRDENGFDYIETNTADLPAMDINCLELDAKNIYVGTPRGLWVIDRDSRMSGVTLDRSQGLSDENITSLQRVGDSLFIGTASGLVVYQTGDDKITYVGQREFYNRVIYDMLVIDEYLWIASSAGAYRLNLETDRLQKFQDPEAVLFNRVFSLNLYDNELWLASDAGILRLNLETGERRPFRISSQKLDSRALAVNDRIAAVSSDYGISIIVFDEGQEPRVKEYGVQDGLASQYVYSLLLDGDYLWVGTDRGLTRFLWNDPFRID